jgi:hypothetical protein
MGYKEIPGKDVGELRQALHTFALLNWARKPALTPYSFLSDLYNGNRVGIQFDGKVLRVIQ